MKRLRGEVEASHHGQRSASEDVDKLLGERDALRETVEQLREVSVREKSRLEKSLRAETVARAAAEERLEAAGTRAAEAEAEAAALSEEAAKVRDHNVALSEQLEAGAREKEEVQDLARMLLEEVRRMSLESGGEDLLQPFVEVLDGRRGAAQAAAAAGRAGGEGAGAGVGTDADVDEAATPSGSCAMSAQNSPVSSAADDDATQGTAATPQTPQAASPAVSTPSDARRSVGGEGGDDGDGDGAQTAQAGEPKRTRGRRGDSDVSSVSSRCVAAWCASQCG